MAKYLVLGSNGLLGHVVTLYLRENGEDVKCLSRTFSPIIQNEVIDLTDFSGLKFYLEKNHFDWVINCAGVLNKAVDENLYEAIKINSLLPHFLFNTLKDKTKVVHISTDCVFDGKKGRYSESNFPNALDNYGITKRLGEINNDSLLTIRTSIVGPETGVNKKGLFDWFMSSENEVKGYVNTIWTGVTTIQLAKFIHSIKDVQISGLVNYVNNETISKFDLLHLFRDTFGKSINISKDEDFKSDKSLYSDYLDNYKSLYPPSYERMVIEMRKWVANHKEIYDY